MLVDTFTNTLVQKFLGKEFITISFPDNAEILSCEVTGLSRPRCLLCRRHIPLVLLFMASSHVLPGLRTSDHSLKLLLPIHPCCSTTCGGEPHNGRGMERLLVQHGNSVIHSAGAGLRGWGEVRHNG